MMDQVDKLAWAHPPVVTSSHNSASGIFYHAVLILRFVGILPINSTPSSSSNLSHRRTFNYTFSVKSLTFLYCSILSTFIVAFWGQFISESLHINPFNFHIFSETTDGSQGPLAVAQNLLYLLFPLTCCFQLLNVILTSPDFAEYLNMWTRFEERFSNIFIPFHPFLIVEPIFPRTIRFRRFSWRFATTLAVLMGVTTYPLLRGQDFSNHSTASKRFEFPVLVIAVMTIFMILVLDLRSNIQLFINEEAFSQIETKIRQKIEKLQSQSLKINSQTIQDWQELMGIARNQAASYERIQGVNLLMELTNLFSTWCSIIFQTIVSAQKGGFGLDSLRNMAPSCLLCIIMYTRLAAKVFFSERLQKAEARIAKLLQTADFSNHDLETSLEINMIIDWISATPSKINICNFFSLDRSLVFNVVAQTVTYVLVLLQFQYLQGS